MDLDNLNSGSEDEAVEAFMSHLDESEPEVPTDDTSDEGEATPAPTEADDSDDDSDDEGEPAPEGDTEESNDAEPETFTVKVNGEELKVTREELTKGYMKDADYRHKTTQLSEAKREFESQKADLLQQYDQRLAELDALISVQSQETNWEELRDTDPSEYLRQKDLLERRTKVRDEALKEAREEQKQQIEAYKAQEAEKLIAAIPDWLDADTRKAETTEMRKTLTEEYGFTAQEVNSLLDHRLVRMARDAMKGREAMQKLEQRKADAKRKVETAPPLSKPKSNNGKPSQDERVKALKSKARKGDMDAAAELMFLGLD